MAVLRTPLLPALLRASQACASCLATHLGNYDKTNSFFALGVTKKSAWMEAQGRHVAAKYSTLPSFSWPVLIFCIDF